MRRLASMLSAVLLALAFCLPAQAADKVHNLIMTTNYMDKHPIVQKVYLPWIEEVKKRTNGQVVITYYNPGTVCPEGEIFEAVKRGQVAIGGHMDARNPGKLPVCGVMNMAMGATTTRSASEAVWRVHAGTPEIQKEFSGIKVFARHATAPMHYHFISTPVRTLEEFKDKKIICGGAEPTRAIRALGGNPITIPAPSEQYVALQRGMGDGDYLPIAPMRSYKFDEVLKYTTLISQATASTWLGMNQGVYDGLPDDAKKALDELTGYELSMRCAAVIDAADKSEMEYMKAHGHEFYLLPQEERKRWIDIALPLNRDHWLEAMKNANLPDAKAIYDRTVNIFAEEEAKHGIYKAQQ